MEEFRCAVCGRAFQSDREAEALAELHANFGPISVEECAVVCDDCYNDIAEWSAARGKPLVKGIH